jgi:uncharacterized protein (DUF1778 family)
MVPTLKAVGINVRSLGHARPSSGPTDPSVRPLWSGNSGVHSQPRSARQAVGKSSRKADVAVFAPTLSICTLFVVARVCYILVLRWRPNMSTTTIRLPKDLKARVAAAAERAGTTAHSFILEAIAEKADQAERRAEFHDVAEKRYADLLASGETISWKRMRSSLEGRVAGKTVARPAVKRLAR